MIKNITCPNCDFTKKVPEEKIPEGIKFAKCPQCNKTFEIDPKEDPGSASFQEPSDNVSDTEESFSTGNITDEQSGYFKVLWQTFKGALFSPTVFFRGKRQEKGIGESFAFGMLLGSVGAMFGIFWQFLLDSQELSFVLELLPEFITMNHLFLGYIIISPFLVFIFMFITAAVLHCCLFILGGANRSFADSFKASAYSNASSVFNLIPYIGQYIGVIWGLIVLVIGLRELHETSTLRAVFALLLPLFLLILLGIVLGFVAAFLFSSQFM